MFPQVILIVSPVTLILMLLVEVLWGAYDINKGRGAEAKREAAKRLDEEEAERQRLIEGAKRLIADAH